MPTVLKLTHIIPPFFVWIWSTGYIGAKFALPYIEPFLLLSTRFALTVGFLSLLLVLFFRKQRLSLRQICQQIGMGMLLHGMYLGGIFYAISIQMPAGIAAIILGLQPLVSSFLGWMFLKESLSKLQILGLILGFVGVVMIVNSRQNLNVDGLNMISLIAIFIALCSISVATILQKKFSQNAPLIAGTTMQYVGAFLLLAPLSMVSETHAYQLNTTLVLSMTWLVLGLSVLGVLLFFYMIKKGKIAQVVSLLYLVPPVTVLQAWLFFDEKIDAMLLLSCTLIVFGVYLTTKNLVKQLS